MFFENLMASIDSVINSINDALYSYVLIAVLLLGGLYFTVRGKFAQIRMLPEQVRVIGEKPAGKGGVSSFQALMVSTASIVIIFAWRLPLLALLSSSKSSISGIIFGFSDICAIIRQAKLEPMTKSSTLA